MKDIKPLISDLRSILEVHISIWKGESWGNLASHCKFHCFLYILTWTISSFSLIVSIHAWTQNWSQNPCPNKPPTLTCGSSRATQCFCCTPFHITMNFWKVSFAGCNLLLCLCFLCQNPLCFLHGNGVLQFLYTILHCFLYYALVQPQVLLSPKMIPPVVAQDSAREFVVQLSFGYLLV
jgi:hypothetical protein